MSEEVQKRRPLAAAEAGARHLLLMIGFGVFSYVGGMIFMGSLLTRLASRTDLSWGVLPFVMAVLVDGGWVMGALPAIAYFASRIMELRPWPTAIIGAFSGLLFQVALIYVSSGEEGLFGSPVRVAMRLGCVAAGVFFTAAAVRTGRANSKASEEKARAEAEKKKHQYDEFVKQSEAIADRREQVPIAQNLPPTDPTKPEPPG